MKYLLLILATLFLFSCEPETTHCYWCDQLSWQYWNGQIQKCWDDNGIECNDTYNHYVLLQCKQWWLDKHCKYREIKTEYAEYICTEGFEIGNDLLSEEYKVPSQRGDDYSNEMPDIKYETDKNGDCE